MLSLRSMLIGLIAIAAICFIVSWAELVTGRIMIGFLQLPPVALAGLFLLVLANRVVSRLFPAARLRPPEIGAIYVMMILAALIASRGLMEDLIPTLVGVNYYANPGNQWADTFFPHIPMHLVPWDPGAGPLQPSAVSFYEGLRQGQALPWAAWLSPLAHWLVPAVAMISAFLCLAAILRRQWSDNERLSFPLVQLPVEMMREQPGRSFFSNPLTWIGFAAPTIIFAINGLHNIYPALPSVTVDININGYFRERPWADMSFFHAYLSLGSVGFFYLLPTELLLSFWFFHLLAKVQDVIVSALAFPEITSPHGSGNGYVDYQTAGAFFVLVGSLALTAMPHLKAVFRRAVGRSGPRGEDEILPYAAAVWGLLISLGIVVVWFARAGMAPGFAAFAVAVYVFVQAIIMSRGTAEAGLPMAEGSFTPLDVSALVVRPHLLGARTLTANAFFDALFSRDLRGITLTAFLDGQKLADDIGLQRRRLLFVLIIAIAAAIPIAAVIHLWIPYREGALGLYSFVYRGNCIQFFRENGAILQREHRHTHGAAVAFLGGGAVTAWLAAMRVRYVGWPFHPLGYALSASWTSMVFWFPMLIAWVVKSLVVRYGGMRLFAKLRPLFLGMIFGEFTSAVVWTLAAAAWDIMPPFFPWP